MNGRKLVHFGGNGKSGLSGLLISSEGEKIIIPLSSLNEKPDDILLAMENFDFQKLENFKDGNEQLLSVGDADSYLKQAHLCYLLEDYVTAYFYSKKAAYLYFHQNDYARYFIAKCNQKFWEILSILDLTTMRQLKKSRKSWNVLT